MKLLITNIKELLVCNIGDRKKIAGKEMDELNLLENAFLLSEDDTISAFGKMSEMPKNLLDNADKIISAEGKIVMPAFCDSHTHIVYAGSREIEYEDKIRGLSYEEIAQKGGGILNSTHLLQETSEDALYEQSSPRLEEIISLGTGAVEIKSGYGLTTASELKMLRVIKRLKEHSPLTIKSTFLGAHSIPMEYRNNQEKYVDIVVNEMIPAVGEEKLADFIDVFCDKGFFTVDETDRILEAAKKYGMIPKIHANELAKSGGIQIGVKHQALSVDHVEYTEAEEIKVLKASHTMPTILPGAAFFLNMPFAPARKMIDAGLAVAFASDYNPGSSPSGNMKLMLSFACVNYKLTPAEALHATTINTAYAMGISEKLGSIDVGKKANILITKKIPSYRFLPYAYGSDLIDTVILNGKIAYSNKNQ
jgi:imidazolonepropionase